MEKYDIEQVKNCYNLTAEKYHQLFHNELEYKPFDRYFLKRFAEGFNGLSVVIECASGSGHIANFIYLNGVKNIVGCDISEKSIEVAKLNYPRINFEYDDMLKSNRENDSVDGIVCFYGIIHFTYEEIDRVLSEWVRILRKNGRCIFSFHVGDDKSVKVNRFLEIDNAVASWNFFNVEKVVELLVKKNIKYKELIIRYPYIGMEHESKRCYVEFAK